MMNSYRSDKPGVHSPHYPLRWSALILLVVVTAAAAAAGTVASIAAPTFYEGLNRPGWAPPAGLFGPVWFVLYVLMAIAAWVVVRVCGWRNARLALVLYAVQLMANALWTWLFFHWHSGGVAFAEIAVLLLLIIGTIAMFWRAHTVAGALLLPYLAWVSFASALTWSVWHRNPGLL